MKKAVDADPSIKLIFLCSPGNPTGTSIPLSAVRELLEYENFKGIVVVDEAYIDFSHEDASAASLVKEYANLCVMQTLSKSFGLAAIRYVLAYFTWRIHSTPVQVGHSTRPPCSDPDSHEHQGAIQHLYSNRCTRTRRAFT